MILAPSDRHRAVGLAGRLRSPPLQAAHAAWLAARTAWHLPTPEQIEAALPEPDDFSLAAVIRGPGETGFQLVRVGAALVRRAGRPLLGEFVGAVAPPPARIRSAAPPGPMAGASPPARRATSSAISTSARAPRCCSSACCCPSAAAP
ncbi:hypothetical protein ACFQY5_01050 [Paeniroseomonas aquatica]|uniref:hypothetical protein n=1 Tax=Paeniroseomonas aquatica TaxID=373043 RepID=UPI00361FC2E9